MKQKFKVPVLDRHSFYILKLGSFLIIVMLAVTLLYYSITVDRIGEAKRYFYALPTARAMLEHTLITHNIIIGGALLLDTAAKSEKN